MVKSSGKVDGSQSIPPFLKKCYEMVDDESTNSLISWNQNSNSFIIWDMAEFSSQLLPKYFKHNNFSSFMRQLNIYGFRKVDSDRWEFANDEFIKDQKHLLKNISRRKNTQDNRKQPPQQENADENREEVENCELWKDVENLKTHKNSLTQEIVVLRQHQESSENKVVVLNSRLKGMEKNQQQMMSFLVMAMKVPGFLAQLIQPKENKWRKAETGSIIEQVDEDSNPTPADGGMMVRYQLPVDEISEPASESENPLESNNSSSDGMKDFFASPDFMKMLLDENLPSYENQVPFVLPDLPDDGAWEKLLLASPITLDSKQDDEKENDTENMEVEETLTGFGTDIEESEKFEAVLDLMSMAETFDSKSTSHGMYFLTQQMDRLASRNP